MRDEKRAFYEYNACLMEPWDGPASIAFSDGSCIGAVLDRNGLRPSRYMVTHDDYVVMASEAGVLDVQPANVRAKGRLQPGRMFLIDTEKGRIVDDEEIKSEICLRKPYRQWLDQNLVTFDRLAPPDSAGTEDRQPLITRQQVFGYSTEDLRIILTPMATDANEPVGSMGDDIPPAILSSRPRLLFDYFKQLFAQVTNPPLDAIREELVTSLVTTIGAAQDLFKETPQHCRQLKLDHPVLTDARLEQIRNIQVKELRAVTLPMLYPVQEQGSGLEHAIQALCRRAEQAVQADAAILILSDRGGNKALALIPSLLATSGVHHHLIRQGLRTRCGIVVETGEAREVHHFCCLIGYGAGAVNPYLVYATLTVMVKSGELKGMDPETAQRNYIKAVRKGILKVMSKMGISTLQSYRGAQIFECVGLSESIIDQYFNGTPSRISGADIHLIAEEVHRRRQHAYPAVKIPSSTHLGFGGKYKWRRDGEVHQYNPITIAKLQQAVRREDRNAWDEFSELVNRQNQQEGLIRGLFAFRPPSVMPGCRGNWVWLKPSRRWY